MNIIDKISIIIHILRWRFTWNRKNLNYRKKGLTNPKFITGTEFGAMIKDGMTIFSAGMAGNHRCSVFSWSIKDSYLKTGHPKGLTWIAPGAQGSRELVPGSLDELAIPGVITKMISGHYNTLRGIPRMARGKHLEMHVLPLGIIALILEAQGHNQMTLTSETGVGTFLDPDVGKGSYVCGFPPTENFVEKVEGKLRYHLPSPDFALFVAPYADEEGNIYFTNGCTYTESYEGSFASKNNGGKVVVSVSAIIPKNEKEIYLPAEMVDYIIIHPYNEQTGSVPQSRYWECLTVGSQKDIDISVGKLTYLNHFVKVTPIRVPAEEAVARAAAKLFMNMVKKGEWINIGTGLPEEVSRMVYEGGIYKDITFFTETGVIGGLPAPGSFFGAAVNPVQIMKEAEMFHYIYSKTELTTILGMIEADSEGNVNVSKRGEDPGLYVGVGGFCDITYSAKNIIFIGSWMQKAKFDISKGKMEMIRPGEFKFVDKVSEITFNGKEGLKKGKNIYYATNVGIFRLTEKGMCLIQVMPGIDIQKDILDTCPMRVVLPDDNKVEVISEEVVSGKGFSLQWPE